MQPGSLATVSPELVTPILQDLAGRIGQRQFQLWFHLKTRFQVNDDVLTVGVSSPFLLKWLQKQFKTAMVAAARGTLGPSAQVEFKVDPASISQETAHNSPTPAEDGSAGLNGVVARLDATGALLQREFGDPPPREPVAMGDLLSVANMPRLMPARAMAATQPGTARMAVPEPAAVLSLKNTLAAVNRPAVPSQPTVDTPRAATAAAISTRPTDYSRAASKPSPATAPSKGRRFADLSELVPGPCNELALTAAWRVCHTPGQEFNPFFVYGPVGTGKTHLLEGIYRQLRRTHPQLQVVYLTSEAFTNYFTQALREHTLPSFRQRFRTVDVLLVDDIDFLDAKKVIQEEFLHTFKQLESHGRQIVVASDRHPRLLSKISDELRTRFLSGMVCRLDTPDVDTREKIVSRKAARLDAEVSPEALRYIAERFTGSVRELEGALHCLQTYHCMTGKRVGISAARQVLSNLERDCLRVVRLTDIERAVCDLFGLEEQDLKSNRRTRSLSHPRMLAMYLARKHTRAAYSEIGQFFGGRNHSTVISAERKIDDWLSEQTPVKVASQTWKISDVLEALEQQLLAG